MSERVNDYDDWAWLYDRTVGPDYCREQMAFLDRVLLTKLAAGGQLLDLCCGTGQMAALLLKRGHRVTGLDGSADMLRYARQNAPEADYVQADARTFTFEQPFDAVICTSASLNHMQLLGDLKQVFQRVSDCLKDDGIFVFDVNHPAQLARYWRGQPAEGEIHADYAWLITPRYDAATAEGAFTVDIYRNPPNGRHAPVKTLIGKLLGHPKLARTRLRLLSRFRRFRPDWESLSATYEIFGHDLKAIEDLLQQTGFDVSLQRVDGEGPVEARHAAHFVCRKRTVSSVELSRKAAS